MIGHRRLCGVLIAVLTASALAGCDQSSKDVSEPQAVSASVLDLGPGVIDAPGGVKVLTAAWTDSGMEALGSGVLTIGPGGCLYLPGSDYDTLLVWPWGTTLAYAYADADADADAAAVVLDVPLLGRVEVGDEVSLGGGLLPLPTPQVPVLPDGCIATHAFMVSGQ